MEGSAERVESHAKEGPESRRGMRHYAGSHIVLNRRGA